MIKKTFTDTFFYAPAYIAFQNLIDRGTRLDKLKNPRVVDDGSGGPPRPKKTRFENELNELGARVGQPAIDDNLEKEVTWLKRKLGEQPTTLTTHNTEFQS